VLTIRAITKTFSVRSGPVHALRGVDLDVPAGRLTAILGASGCGKSTLLRIVAGFERADSGEVEIDGERLAAPGVHVPPERRRIGIVPQEGALFPHLDVAHNIAFGLGRGAIDAFSPVARRRRAARVEELLELVGLRGYGKRSPGELSGGQQQRVALARALAPGPRLVLLDEPFSAIDTALRVGLREEVRDLLRGLGATAILVTHDQGEALSLADHVAVMRDGRVVQAGAPAEVYRSPHDPETAAFLGDAVLLPGVIHIEASCPEPYVECALGRVRLRGFPASHYAAGPCTVMLRPEHLQFTEGGTPARVISTSYVGHAGLVRLRLGLDGDGALVQVRTSDQPLPEPGCAVGIRVTSDATVYAA
jgi:iron(III) transport system ATP-binding protein